ncbi:hypothetical protein MTP03_04890 [Tsukamurella sp. PLM1]|nr:hypothetical protein MTP03_04890 [Tsukamurella sp. PLM1]
MWRKDPAEGWIFDDTSTWVEVGGIRHQLSAEQVVVEALAWAPDWTLTTTFPAASHESSPSLPLRAHPAVAPPTTAEIEARRHALVDWAAANGFAIHVNCPTPRAIAARLGASRAGIYLIEFHDGSCYVGKAIDIANRFRAHAKKYDDISSIRLRPEPAALAAPDPNRYLLCVEKTLIDQAQFDHLTARNKDGMSVILATDQQFDKLMSIEDQESWRADRLAANGVDLAGERSAGVDTLSAGAAYNFGRFSSVLADVDQRLVVDIVAAFLARCVPLPLHTEVRHWTLSCMPSTVRGNTTQRSDTVACLSVGSTEALTITRSKKSGHLSGFVHVYEPELTDGSEYEYIALARRTKERAWTMPGTRTLGRSRHSSTPTTS